MADNSPTGVRFFTLSEGEISSLHVGMKGTMNAMFLTELANKTRRGLEGRERAGRGTGTVPYGYRRVTGILRPDGEVERGLREIDPGETIIVRRIFSEYVMGLSPIAIARRLNEDRIPGPTGQGWNHFTIRGRSGHDTGLLRNLRRQIRLESPSPRPRSTLRTGGDAGERRGGSRGRRRSGAAYR